MKVERITISGWNDDRMDTKIEACTYKLLDITHLRTNAFLEVAGVAVLQKATESLYGDLWRWILLMDGSDKRETPRRGATMVFGEGEGVERRPVPWQTRGLHGRRVVQEHPRLQIRRRRPLYCKGCTRVPPRHKFLLVSFIFLRYLVIENLIFVRAHGHLLHFKFQITIWLPNCRWQGYFGSTWWRLSAVGLNPR